MAHLLAAASGLPWKPRGTRDEVCVAEFHAVLLEHLAVAAFDAVHLGRCSGESPLARALEHARWFVERHYAPFPMNFETALACFRTGLEVEPLVRLSPLFFRTRAFELEHGDFQERTFSGRFCSSFRPEVDSLSREPQRELARQVAVLADAR